MHPPRHNSAYPVNQLGDNEGQGADQSAANQIEGREETPVWQKAFVLGPNVRFTRTPDRAATKPEPAPQTPVKQPTAAMQPAQQRPAPAQASQRVAASQPRHAPAPSTSVPYAGLPRTGAQAPAPAPKPETPRMPASVTLPQPPDAVGARALTYKLRRELARQQAEQAAWEASMADGGVGQIGPAPQPPQPAPLVQGMRTVLASTQAASVGATMQPTTEAHVPPHLQRSIAQQAEAARLAAQQAAPAARPPMVRNAFLRTPPVQTNPEPGPASSPQSAPVQQMPDAAATSQPQASGFAAWAQMTNPPAPQAEATAATTSGTVDVGTQGLRPAIASLLSDHIFFEAMGPAPLDVPQDIEMVRPSAQPPVTQTPKRVASQAVRQITPPTVRTSMAPQAQAAIRAEVVRYRPDALTTSVQPMMALPHKPAFDATPGSVVALYREVARREVSISNRAMAQALTAVAETVAPLEAVVPAPVQANHASIVPVSAALPRQPLFKAQEALGEAEYELPYLDYLQMPPVQTGVTMTAEALEQSAGLLESVLEDFGVKGEVIDVRPGPVVTLYEFEPAPGVKSSRVIGLSDDIARSMSALSARVAVVPGRNVIGIELPNPVRETVYLRELIETPDYAETRYKLPVCLGKTIGGEPVIAELAKMPHLLVAGTTGSGKSVAINTMILSLLYRFRPDECRLIMVDPKMLELSVYDGIPHLLTPVVTDPKKAVMALKWAVREMEDRYRKMSRLGVRNIDGYNARAAQAREKGETITVTVQTGFDRQSGEIVYEEQELDLSPMPYIVVVVDEMADLMMVAGKEIEGAIQRLAQMARAAGIHLIMATQRPVGRCHHRHDQGELPDPRLLPGDLEDRQPYHSG